MTTAPVAARPPAPTRSSAASPRLLSYGGSRNTTSRGAPPRLPAAPRAGFFIDRGAARGPPPPRPPAAISRGASLFARSESAPHGTQSSAHAREAQLAAPALEESLAEPAVGRIPELRI